MLVGDVDVRLPNRLYDRRVQEVRIGLAGGNALGEEREGLVSLAGPGQLDRRIVGRHPRHVRVRV